MRTALHICSTLSPSRACSWEQPNIPLASYLTKLAGERLLKVPCFSNAPLKCFRRRGDAEARGDMRGFECRPFPCGGPLGTWLGTWRCCTRAGNFTVLLERLPQKTKAEYSKVHKPDPTPGGGGSDGTGLDLIGARNGGGGGAEAAPRELWLVVGPYWPFCLALTTSLVVTIPAGLSLLLWGVVHSGVLLALLAVAGITLLSLGLTACRDPGSE